MKPPPPSSPRLLLVASLDGDDRAATSEIVAELLSRDENAVVDASLETARRRAVLAPRALRGGHRRVSPRGAGRSPAANAHGTKAERKAPGAPVKVLAPPAR